MIDAKELKRVRTTLRLTQSALARQTGVSRWHIWRVELGDRQFTPAEANRIEAAIQRETQRMAAATARIRAERATLEA